MGIEQENVKPEADVEGQKELRIYSECGKEPENFKGGGDMVTHGECGCYSKHSEKPVWQSPLADHSWENKEWFRGF